MHSGYFPAESQVVAGHRSNTMPLSFSPRLVAGSWLAVNERQYQAEWTGI